MPEAINEYCLQNNQPEAYSIGEIANCIFASIAVQIKSVFEEIKLLTGKDDFDGICVVGGAVKNDLLMQMVSDAISLPLYKGSEFSASIGNLLMQMYTNHELNSIGEIKEVAMNTSGLNVVRPKGSQRKWTDALGSMIKYRTINERENNGRKN